LPDAGRTRAAIALGLGGNLGAVETILRRALRELATVVDDLRVAPLYRTRPVSSIPQPDFLNTAAVGATRLAPEELLLFARGLERRAGRVPGPRNAPRPLDVDLLVYGSEELSTSSLTLPHPRLRERRFVLAPLAAIAPDLRVPPDRARVATLLEQLGPMQEADRVELVDWSAPPLGRSS
jgi:2-amino-4-hydroxy-6-hydroxymethyldihydropteridine diphosphokinase